MDQASVGNKLLPMSHAEIVEDIYMCLLVNARWLPQLKGPGALKGQARETALKALADVIAAQFRVSGRVILRPAPKPLHGVGTHD